jgi:hypothetical protein
VALPLEPAVRQVAAVERENRPDCRVSGPGQEVADRQVVAAADERVQSAGPSGLAPAPSAPTQRAGERAGPCSSRRHQQ